MGALTCPACGEPDHGPSLCRPALATRLAEEISERADDHRHILALELRVAELERKLADAVLPRYGR